MNGDGVDEYEAQLFGMASPEERTRWMLAELEHAVLVDRLRATARDWCEEAGARGAELWKRTQ